MLGWQDWDSVDRGDGNRDSDGNRGARGEVPRRPAAGRIMFNGVDLRTVPAHVLVGQGLAHCPEGRKIFATMTAFSPTLADAFWILMATGYPGSTARHGRRGPSAAAAVGDRLQCRRAVSDMKPA